MCHPACEGHNIIFSNLIESGLALHQTEGNSLVQGDGWSDSSSQRIRPKIIILSEFSACSSDQRERAREKITPPSPHSIAWTFSTAEGLWYKLKISFTPHMSTSGKIRFTKRIQSAKNLEEMSWNAMTVSWNTWKRDWS